MTAPMLVVQFPLQGELPLYWWRLAGDRLMAQGCDKDPLLAADLKLLPDDEEKPVCVALLPTALTVVRRHQRPDIADGHQASDAQIIAAAILAAHAGSIDGDNLHVAANIDGDGNAVSAAVDRNILLQGLGILAELGLDPDRVVPAGCLIIPVEDGAAQADFGFEQILRDRDSLALDEPFAREHLFADKDIVTLPKAGIDAALAVADQAIPNLRTGAYAKRAQHVFAPQQKRVLGWLIAALVVVSIAIPLAQWAKYQWAIDAADTQALAAAQAVIGPVDDVDAANRQLDARLIAENRGNMMLTVPASALFSAMQQAPGVSIERLSYAPSGIVSAVLTAVRNEDINPVLLTLQNAGFLVTATPRTDATGKVKADITVRAP